jgi:hypothetical protein
MKRYAFMLVALLGACGGGSSAVAPTLTTTPSPSPGGSVTSASPAASPSSLAFSSGTAQNVTVTESGYVGAFTESDTCSPYAGEIAAVSPGVRAAGSATYAVTPEAAGMCAITVTDSQGRAAAVDVTVSTAAITVQ